MSYFNFAKYYDILTSNINYKKRAEYFNEIIKKYNKEAKLILDLACGTGSLSVEFSNMGYDVIGVDGSSDMLSIAVTKKDNCKNDILFVCQDMRELDLYGGVDATVCALDSINHVTDINDLEIIFKKVGMFSNQQALFIFDVNTIYKHREILSGNTFVYDYDEIYCVWQNEICTNDNIIEINLDFFEYENGAYYRSYEQFCEKAYSIDEIKIIAQKAGMEIIDIFSDDTFNPPKEDSQRLIYVAKKVK